SACASDVAGRGPVPVRGGVRSAGAQSFAAPSRPRPPRQRLRSGRHRPVFCSGGRGGAGCCAGGGGAGARVRPGSGSGGGAGAVRDGPAVGRGADGPGSAGVSAALGASGAPGAPEDPVPAAGGADRAGAVAVPLRTASGVPLWPPSVVGEVGPVSGAGGGVVVPSGAPEAAALVTVPSGTGRGPATAPGAPPAGPGPRPARARA